MSRLTGNRPVLLTIFLGLLGPLLSQAQTLHLPAMLDGEDAALWHVNDTTLEKNGHSVWAYLDVSNISGTVVQHERFYAEYQDALGRTCFLLVFAQEASEKDPNAPFRPGERRRLDSGTSSIFPATQPTSVRIHAVSGTSSGNLLLSVGDGGTIPATIMGGISAKDAALDLREPAPGESPLALLSLIVDSQGKLGQSSTLSAVSAEAGQKLTDFISYPRFLPALTKEGPTDSRLLILFTTFQSALFSSDSAWPWDLPAVIQFVTRLGPNDEVPVVTVLAFEPATEPPNSSQLVFFPLGSDWCPDLFVWVAEPGSNRRVREWHFHAPAEIERKPPEASVR